MDDWGERGGWDGWAEYNGVNEMDGIDVWSEKGVDWMDEVGWM